MPQHADTVLIAGGTQGIGKGIALHLAKTGVKQIILCGRNEQEGQATVKAIQAAGSEGLFIQADLSRVADCQKVFASCEKHFSHLSSLVYAAGVSPRSTIDTLTEKTWDQIFDTNVKGAFFLTQALLPLLRKEAPSSIVTLCSFSSYCGKPDLIAYNASKAALVTFTKSLANTLKEEKIRVNGINLGWTDTENERSTQTALGNAPQFLDEIGAKQPFGRLLSPQDIAYLVEFLLSHKAEMMTGSIIDFHQNVRV